jgi:methyl-accepting chemotaxis protein
MAQSLSAGDLMRGLSDKEKNKLPTRKDEIGAISRAFDGMIDEVRLWKTIRTADEIRANMHRRLTGAEPGLHALWNFDDSTARDSGPAGLHGQFKNKAATVEATIPELQAAMASGELSSKDLVKGYLDRIQSLNSLLHSVIETNPNAVSIAQHLDN